MVHVVFCSTMAAVGAVGVFFDGAVLRDRLLLLLLLECEFFGARPPGPSWLNLHLSPKRQLCFAHNRQGWSLASV
jgi:hypothetical protein